MATEKLYVRVVNGIVKDVFNALPPGQNVGSYGWREAVEIRPEISNKRNCYGNHYFDLTKNPVEIIWPVNDLTIDERKYDLKIKLKTMKMGITEKHIRMEMNDDPTLMMDYNVLDTWFIEIDAKLATLANATTHEDLDPIWDYCNLKQDELANINASGGDSFV